MTLLGEGEKHESLPRKKDRQEKEDDEMLQVQHQTLKSCLCQDAKMYLSIATTLG